MKKILFLFSTIICLMTNLYADKTNQQEEAATAMYDKGYLLGELGKYEKAISVYDELIVKFKNSTNEMIQEIVVSAIQNEYELFISLDKKFSPQYREFIANIYLTPENKAIFEMLDIITNAKTKSQDNEIKKWQSDYDDIKEAIWEFSIIREWIKNSSYDNKIKVRIERYIQIFENHFYRD
jgi:tetratricopeptide (TPR) repeat protein